MKRLNKEILNEYQNEFLGVYGEKTSIGWDSKYVVFKLNRKYDNIIVFNIYGTVIDMLPSFKQFKESYAGSLYKKVRGYKEADLGW